MFGIATNRDACETVAQVNVAKYTAEQVADCCTRRVGAVFVDCWQVDTCFQGYWSVVYGVNGDGNGVRGCGEGGGVAVG